jgi:hypothetical protein
MIRMIGAALLLIFLLSIHAQGKVQGDPIVIGTQPEIQNPELKDPKTLDEAKKQIAQLKEAIATNHIIWTIHCKAEEEKLLKHFSTINQNQAGPTKKANASATPAHKPGAGSGAASSPTPVPVDPGKGH